MVGNLLALIFALTVGLSAFLLFWLQLFTAKSVLPLLGGTPAVWNGCQCFFLVMLLAGYGWAHGLARRWPVGRQVWGQAIVLGLALVVLPIGFPAEPPGGQPLLWLGLTLAGSVGLPFFALAATGPLLQSWWGRVASGRLAPPSGNNSTDGSDGQTAPTPRRDPYWLYAASNGGSLLAVLGYPGAIEPWLNLADQARLWQGGYCLVAVLVLGCGWWARRQPVRPAEPATLESETLEPTLETTVHPLVWLTLAFLPASASLGVTMYITTDIAAVPLLWAVPLAIYLLTFIWAFRPGARAIAGPDPLAALLPIVLVPLIVLSRFDGAQNLGILLVGHWLGLALVGLVCHRWLAATRPEAGRATEFYWWTALGGALAGVGQAISAPLMFEGILEYPLTLVAVLAIVPSRGRWGWGAIGLGLGILLVGFRSANWSANALGLALVMAGLAIVGRVFGLSWGRWAIAALGVVLVAQFSLGLRGPVEWVDRSFFGLNRLVVDPSGPFRQLLHGTTLHGQQHLTPARQDQPLTYFSASGPVGQFFAAWNRLPRQRVAVLGLGVGTLAAYGQPGQAWTFYEIDPVVAQVAQNPRWFTFLARSRAQVQVQLGDGRWSLKAEDDRSFDAIVMDAFSSDAIPVHLLTREAIALYFRKLKPNGLLLVNLTNRYVNLLPVLGAIARDLDLVGLHQWERQVSNRERMRGKTPSHWAVLGRDRAEFGALAADGRWQAIAAPVDFPAWRDDFSNVLRVLRLGG